MPKFTISFFSVLFAATSALAMTCLNDYSGNGKGCAKITEAAGDCATLGYSTNEVSGCKRYLYCPFDESYKRCVSRDDSSNTCDEIQEFAVCQTNDTCLGGDTFVSLNGSSSSCYYCKDGFEYKTSMTGYRQKQTEGTLTLKYIYSVRPSNWTADGWENLTVAGCQCIKKWGCEEYPLLTSSVDATDIADLEFCPLLGTCTTCTDTCGNQYAKVSSCVENAEMVDGKCQCKNGYFQQGGKCIDCSEEYDNLHNIGLYRYWLGVKSGHDGLDFTYDWLTSTVGPQGTSGDGFQVDHDVPTETTPTAACPDRSNAIKCCSYTQQLEERINTFNQRCPTMKVSMPFVECGSICTQQGSSKSDCYGNICSTLE